jgi:hypothetical protein
MHVYMYRYTSDKNIHKALTIPLKDGADTCVFRQKYVSKTKKKPKAILK